MPERVRVLCPLLLHEFIHSGLIVFPALPQHVHSVQSGASVRNPFPHALVEPAAPETSSHNEYVLPCGVETIFLYTFRLHFRSGGDDDASDRVAGHHYPVGGEEFLHALVGHADFLHPAP